MFTRADAKRGRLATAGPSPIPRPDLAALVRRYAGFRFRSFAEAGYNALVLPVLVPPGSSDHLRRTALSLSFLIARDLELDAGCYCTFNHFFVFKRSREAMTKLAQKYDSATLRAMFAEWKCTHAVGGLLKRTDAGYTATITIYNPEGKEEHRLTFANPQSIWDLLGDISAALMQHLRGAPPSPALIEHLHQPRCSDDRLLALLGQAAFAEERSDAEFGIYRQVLAADPDFAEVRSYAASQRWWMDQDNATHTAEQIKSLSRRVHSTIYYTHPRHLTDQTVAARFPALFAEARRLLGDEHPWLAAREAMDLVIKKSATRADLSRLIAIAGKWPNTCTLLVMLADLCRSDDVDDNHLAASILLIAIANRYQPGIGNKNPAFYDAANSLNLIGHHPVMVALLGAIENPEVRDYSLYILALVHSGHYEQACRIYREAAGKFSELRDSAYGATIFAAAIGGMTEPVDQLLTFAPELLRKHGLLAWTQAVRKMLDGAPMPAEGFAGFFKGRSWQDQFFIQLLGSQTARGKDLEKYRESFYLYAPRGPQLRLGWVVLDQFERERSTELSIGFHDTLAWLHADDPWVKAIIEPRPGYARSPDPDEMLALLAEAPTTRLPPVGGGAEEPARAWLKRFPFWTAAGSMALLLKAGRRDDAHRLALQYHFLTRQGSSGNRHLANHLIYRIEFGG